jgi:hypothetical protein
MEKESPQKMECLECGSMNCEVVNENYTIYYDCPDCGYEGYDFYEDLYGCMSVPWGYLL